LDHNQKFESDEILGTYYEFAGMDYHANQLTISEQSSEGITAS
jgi:hypothetical protein